MGSVVTGPKEVEDDKITQPLKSVIRIATEDDEKKEEKNKEKEKEAFKICRKDPQTRAGDETDRCGIYI